MCCVCCVYCVCCVAMCSYECAVCAVCAVCTVCAVWLCTIIWLYTYKAIALLITEICTAWMVLCVYTCICICCLVIVNNMYIG